MKFLSLAWTGLLLVAATQVPVAEPERGRLLFESRCIACHSLDAHRVGPALRGVYGRPAGSAEGYSYSSALSQATHLWTAGTLERWLSGPEAFLPGQRMGYTVPSSADRADLIAWLATLEADAPAGGR